MQRPPATPEEARGILDARIARRLDGELPRSPARPTSYTAAAHEGA